MLQRGLKIIALGLQALILPVLAAGCGSSGGAVTGTVTYDGKTIDKGFISFFPVDGKGQTAGGEIANGKYTVKNVAPGKNRVEIKAVPAAATQEPPAANMAEAHKRQQAHPVEDPLPATAKGNNQVMDIQKGSQTLNFTLEKP